MAEEPFGRSQGEPKHWKLLIATTKKGKVSLVCIQWPIPCMSCDLKERCEKDEEPVFDLKELNDAGINYILASEFKPEEFG